MNHTITDNTTAYVVEHFAEEGQKSLLQRVTERLISALKSQRRQPVAQPQVQTYIEASLLDSNIGPEIERALR